ncbi:MAG TPA: putative glycolipid-binding domain-containing protein [Caulobacteraceae bacterium]|nr:putative glycolipid-binding domain-containing protein [Caulobacteraceae bacterium]
MSALVSPLWTALYAPGLDACRIERLADGWRLAGTAVFAHERGPASLAYSVDCAPDWTTRNGDVRGWIGDATVEADIRRGPQGWTLNGEDQPQVEGCLDLDYGFTPATNRLQMSRAAIGVGQTVDFDVAWFDGEGGLRRLPQTYERLTPTTYRYASPDGDYRAVLEMDDNGFVTHYPTLWRAQEPMA